MSDMNGELFLTKLQSIFTDKLPPIIVTSVEYKASIFEHAGNLGIIGFLYKPFTKDMLVSVLDQAHLIPKKRHSRMHTSHEHKKAHPSHEHPKTS
jgi:DNA-binding NarL/FixJ family response regulator